LIYEIKTFNEINSWKLLQEIKEHHQTVSDIDWSVDEKLLTVSHDRSVFVWRKNNDKWEKMFVNIDVRLSAMACKWALSCKKFAIAALPTSLIVGYYSP
jgi:WD40 repeat protein